MYPEPGRGEPARPVRFDRRLGFIEVHRAAALLKSGRPVRRLERPMPDDRLSCLVNGRDDNIVAHDGELPAAGACVAKFEHGRVWHLPNAASRARLPRGCGQCVTRPGRGPRVSLTLGDVAGAGSVAPSTVSACSSASVAKRQRNVFTADGVDGAPDVHGKPPVLWVRLPLVSE